MSVKTTCGGEKQKNIVWKVALMRPKYENKGIRRKVEEEEKRKSGAGERAVEVGDAFT